MDGVKNEMKLANAFIEARRPVAAAEREASGGFAKVKAHVEESQIENPTKLQLRSLQLLAEQTMEHAKHALEIEFRKAKQMKREGWLKLFTIEREADDVVELSTAAEKALDEALRADDAKEMARLIHHHAIDVNRHVNPSWGFYLLHEAVLYNAVSCVELLLKPKKEGEEKTTPAAIEEEVAAEGVSECCSLEPADGMGFGADPNLAAFSFYFLGLDDNIRPKNFADSFLFRLTPLHVVAVRNVYYDHYRRDCGHDCGECNVKEIDFVRDRGQWETTRAPLERKVTDQDFETNLRILDLLLSHPSTNANIQWFLADRRSLVHFLVNQRADAALLRIAFHPTVRREVIFNAAIFAGEKDDDADDVVYCCSKCMQPDALCLEALGTKDYSRTDAADSDDAPPSLAHDRMRILEACAKKVAQAHDPHAMMDTFIDLYDRYGPRTYSPWDEMVVRDCSTLGMEKEEEEEEGNDDDSDYGHCCFAERRMRDAFKKAKSNFILQQRGLSYSMMLFAADSGSIKFMKHLLEKWRHSSEESENSGSATEGGIKDFSLKRIVNGAFVNVSSNSTLLTIAVHRKRIEMVRYLLTVGGADPRLRCPATRDSPLFIATVFNYPSLIRLLILEHGVDINEDKETKPANCVLPPCGLQPPHPLACGAQRGCLDAVMCLLDLGADPNAVCPGTEPSTALEGAIASKSLPIVKLLLARGADPLLLNTLKELSCITALAPGACNRVLQAILDSPKMSLGAKNQDGVTESSFLHMAACAEPEKLRLVLQRLAKTRTDIDARRAILEARDKTHATPLMRAFYPLPLPTIGQGREYHIAANVRLLLEAGADADRCLFVGPPPKKRPANAPLPTPFKDNLLCGLIRRNRRNLVQILVTGNLLNQQRQPQKSTKTSSSSTKTTSSLINLSAVLVPSGKPALCLAAMFNQLDTVRLLIDAGADLTVRAAARRMNTPLHFAAEKGHRKMCLLLLGVSSDAPQTSALTTTTTPTTAKTKAAGKNSKLPNPPPPPPLPRRSRLVYLANTRDVTPIGLAQASGHTALAEELAALTRYDPAKVEKLPRKGAAKKKEVNRKCKPVDATSSSSEDGDASSPNTAAATTTMRVITMTFPFPPTAMDEME